MTVEREGELELRADAVGTGYQHGVAIPLPDVEERAKAADASENLGPQRAFRERLDPLDQRIARVNVYAGFCIGMRNGDMGAGAGHGSARCASR